MAYRWVFAESDHQESAQALQKSLGVSRPIAKLLTLREIESFEQAREFFRPDLDQLHDPFLMKDMEEATDRLCHAIRNHERILIYGDYDVDGTTATSVLYLFLKGFGLDVHYFIPHRFKDGYGINTEGIHHASELEVDLIISVDCGISAIEEALYARSMGIDLIVCDHHTAGDVLPDACAVLDPKRPDCSYPFDGLSGAGVAYKLLQATVQQLGLTLDMAMEYLDLVAISIASDIVPVIDENRVLMRRGLEQINREPRPGLDALLRVSKKNGTAVSANTILFFIGPRINAAGRMGDASMAVELLISQDRRDAMERARRLETVNSERKKTDSRTLDMAMEQLERDYDLESLSSMVLHDPEWHLGVIGIVASRLVDTYYRPVVMLSTVDGMVKGSARSIDGFNIYEALSQCEDLLERFGGHKYAAGLTMRKENLEEFRRRMDHIASQKLNESDFHPELVIDHQLDLDDVNSSFWKLLSQFEPFGPGNARPVFVSRQVKLAGLPTIVGDGHLKMKVSQNGSSAFDVIGFNMHEYLPLVREAGNGRLDLAYELEENHWRSRRTLQLRLRDIHVNGASG